MSSSEPCLPISTSVRIDPLRELYVQSKFLHSLHVVLRSNLSKVTYVDVSGGMMLLQPLSRLLKLSTPIILNSRLHLCLTSGQCGQRLGRIIV